MPDVSTEVAIATYTADGTTNPITFTSIPGTYTDLRLVVVARANQGTTGGYSNAAWRYNSNSSSLYSGTEIYGDGSTATSDSWTGQTYNWITGTPYSGSTGPYSLITLDIFNYAGSKFKTALATASSDRNGSGQVWRSVNLWRSTSAITSISFDIDTFGGVSGRAFGSGSTFTLYGIL